ncbi:WD40 repeat-like protein [Neocallimastix lanati (nom. inval.)]|jgi:pleiotropic regulator 1|nr:WD40 repeat-like protein [Neocallimastix sp. JGI-2020a]
MVNKSSDKKQLDELVKTSIKRTRSLFKDEHENPILEDEESQRVYLSSKIRDEYKDFYELPQCVINQQQQQQQKAKKQKVNNSKIAIIKEKTTIKGPHPYPNAPGTTLDESNAVQINISDSSIQKTIETIPNISEGDTAQKNNNALTIFHQETTPVYKTASSLIRIKKAKKAPKPEWHAPWKLMRVISGHLGWVRSIAVDPSNEWFATGAGDRIIKIWDLASGTLKLSLTGHISAVRGLCISSRHPYLFSAGEDKQIKCWDLEQNKVIRHYHGHLSAVYSLALHPTLDILVSGGRDSTARVWDMRTKSQIFAFTGHNSTVSDVKCQAADPQVLTASMDSTIRLWDLAAGKTMTTLTHHKKSVRSLALHPVEFSFASASPDNIKQWNFPEGNFVQNLEGHNAIVNTLSINHDNVLFSGGDNGSMYFWDWKSGYNFQKMETTAQPGSLDSEAGILCSTFDQTGTRLITGEADKTIKIWKEDENAYNDHDN